MAGLVLQILVEIAATHHAGEIPQRVGEQGMADFMSLYRYFGEPNCGQSLTIIIPCPSPK